MRKYFVIWCLTLMYLTGFGQNKTGIESLLPEVKEESKWKIMDSATVYTGDDLYRYINGGADIYLEYGFEELAACRYMNYAANNILVDIYKMNDVDAAYGVFTLNSTIKGHPLDLGDMSLLYDYYLDIWKGPYFIRFTANRKDNGMIDTLLMFAGETDSKIELTGKKPQLTRAFNIPDAEIRSVKYIKGIIGLNNVFNFGHGSIAGFSEGLYGKWEDKLLFVFSYRDDRNRREWFASARGKMQMSRKFSDYTPVDDGFTVKDKSGGFLSFKPYKRFILIVKGLGWEDAKPVFEQMQQNLESL